MPAKFGLGVGHWLSYAPGMGEAERYLTAKELAGRLSEIGIPHSDRWVRAAWAAGAPNAGRFGRLSDMLAWMRANPTARPRARHLCGR